MSEETRRVFVALPLPEPLRRQIGAFQRQLATTLPDLRWAPPGQWHLTLLFHPALPVEQVERVGPLMLSIGRRFPPFTLLLSHLGVFPRPAAARVLWLGAEDDAPLQQLQGQLATAVQPLGWPPETRPFHPHLTLGRARRPQRLTLERLPTPQLAAITVERMVLYQSELRPQGAVHRMLIDAPLCGASRAAHLPFHGPREDDS